LVVGGWLGGRVVVSMNTKARETKRAMMGFG